MCVTRQQQTLVEADGPYRAKRRRQREYLPRLKHHLKGDAELPLLRLHMRVAPLGETRPRRELSDVGARQLILRVKVGQAVAQHVAHVLEHVLVVGTNKPLRHSNNLFCLRLSRGLYLVSLTDIST